METGDMFVAESGGRIIGFAAAITRGRIRFLAELYVRPEHRSKSIGRKLLEQLLPEEGSTVCTLSSDDARALALYVRSGMQPYWPYFYLRINAADLKDCQATEIEVAEAEPATLTSLTGTAASAAANDRRTIPTG